MIIRLKYLLFLFAIFLCNYTNAQTTASTSLKPRWLSLGISDKNDNYTFIVAEGTGSDLEEAKQRCFADMLTKLEHERGIVVNSRLSATSKMTRSSGVQNFEQDRTFNIEYTENGKQINVNARVIDDYWINRLGVYHSYILYTVANNAIGGSSYIDDIIVTPKYGVNGLWRSVIVPGLGQFYKGSKAKGGIILGGTAALAIGIILTESQRSDYISKLAQTQNAEHMRTYKTKADNMATVRNICIGGVAALYVYNLIDAVVAPGAKRVIIKKNKFTERIAIAPIFSDKINGVYLAYKF